MIPVNTLRQKKDHVTIIYPLFLPRTPGPIEANNWKEVSDELADGTQITGHHYVPQEAESQHFASLQEAARDKLAGTNMREAINLVLEDPSRSSPDFAAKAVQWARNATDTPKARTLTKPGCENKLSSPPR
jgi:hypothetical protein